MAKSEKNAKLIKEDIIFENLKNFPNKSLAKAYMLLFCTMLKNNNAVVEMDKVINLIQQNHEVFPIMHKILNSKTNKEDNDNYIRKTNSILKLFNYFEILECLFNSNETFVVGLKIKKSRVQQFLNDDKQDNELLKEIQLIALSYNNYVKQGELYELH